MLACELDSHCQPYKSLVMLGRDSGQNVSGKVGPSMYA